MRGGGGQHCPWERAGQVQDSTLVWVRRRGGSGCYHLHGACLGIGTTAPATDDPQQHRVPPPLHDLAPRPPQPPPFRSVLGPQLHSASELPKHRPRENQPHLAVSPPGLCPPPEHFPPRSKRLALPLSGAPPQHSRCKPCLHPPSVRTRVYHSVKCPRELRLLLEAQSALDSNLQAEGFRVRGSESGMIFQLVQGRNARRRNTLTVTASSWKLPKLCANQPKKTGQGNAICLQRSTGFMCRFFAYLVPRKKLFRCCCWS